MQRKFLVATGGLAMLAACHGVGSTPATGAALASPSTANAMPFALTEIASFDEPWAMCFLPDGRVLVTEKKGRLKLLQPGGGTAEVSGVPAVEYGGQGGLGDVVAHPDYAINGLVFLSFIEKGEGDTRGAVVARAKLQFDASGAASLANLTIIWRQEPKKEGNGHFSQRIRFGPDHKLWITSGERQAFDPAQDMGTNLGKVIRLNEDGSVPADNPFANRGDPGAQAWTLGHRNMLGFAFDAAGRPWVAEMGPDGGDELNLIVRGRNYGWPKVSNGNNYDGSDIPDHPTAAQFEPPKISWTPVIAPSSLIFYSGTQFPDWHGDALIGGLASQAVVRVEFDGDTAREAARYPMGKRIREVEQGPAGDVWLLEDGSGGRLLKLTPSR